MGLGDEMTQTLRERRPSNGLAPYVTCVWVHEVSPESRPYRQRTVPNGSAELVCEIGAPARIVGPQTGPVDETLLPGSIIVGVRFQPGVTRSLLGVPGSAIVDVTVSADELWKGAATALGEAVAAAASPKRAAALLEMAVSERLRDAPDTDRVVDEAVSMILASRANDVGSLAASLHLSERHLRRRCDHAIGFGPKVVQRMVRFQRFMALAGTYERPSDHLARLAADAGYADQSHLTRESLRLHGLTPLGVTRDAEQHCQCAGHDHTATYGRLITAI